MIHAIQMLVDQLKDGHPYVQNQYLSAVREEGNEKANNMMEDAFDISDVSWRD